MSAALRVVLAVQDPTREARLREGLTGHGKAVSVVAVVRRRQDLLPVLEHAAARVLVLDLDLPGGGQQALEDVMRGSALPVAVVGGNGAEGRRALAAGAVEVWDADAPADLAARARTLSRVGVISRGRSGTRPTPGPVPGAPPAPPTGAARARRGLPPVVALGASTGGPPAVAQLLTGLAGVEAPILVVQHIGAGFVSGLVRTLATITLLPVEVGRAGVVVEAGHVYIAPPDAHLRLLPGRVLGVSADPPALHMPSVDELFASIAACADVAGIGVLLTGMGQDGAQGLLQMRKGGHATLAQDESSSAVYGMPMAAAQLGAAGEVLPLDRLAARVQDLVRANRATGLA